MVPGFLYCHKPPVKFKYLLLVNECNGNRNKSMANY